MKSKLLLSLLLLSFYMGVAQVGINTNTPDPSSILDIQATNKGMLIPRVALISTTDVITIENPAEGLMVYNTTEDIGISPGFYFWDGADWVVFNTGNGGSGNTGGGSDEKWSKGGDNLTGNEFLGSTNYQSLQFRVNNNEMGLLHPNGGVAFGANAEANPNNSVAVGTDANASTSNEAVAIGPSTSATGFRSTAIGYNANASNGNSTVALGDSASATSFQSVAIGKNASTSGNNNAMALGTNSTATGENSTALGTSSSASGQYSMALGYGAEATQPNTIILGNDISDASQWAATKVGIGTANPTEKLEVHGNIRIAQGKLKMENSTLQLADGTHGEGKVLVSDANGNTSWADMSATSQQAYADIYSNSNQNLVSWNPVNFGSTIASENVNVNNNNFQITVAGTYRVTYAVAVQRSSGSDTNVRFRLAKGWNSNFIPGTSGYSYVGNGDTQTVQVSKILQLNAWDQLYVCTDASNSDNMVALADGTFFNIELIKAD
ncbi:hypothetical protein [Luteirhabdus pelagi]|uniref:hypothetical protein n=1 Tax=Luteirhabdus pelagi TaxID=2792783 RepID=UPI00193A7B85|nr:hypothetical protein [Luteirhabdus pelagi]